MRGNEEVMTRRKIKWRVVLGKNQFQFEDTLETTEKTSGRKPPESGKWKAALLPLIQVVSLVGRLVFGMF